jgi:hypothetical protein
LREIVMARMPPRSASFWHSALVASGRPFDRGPFLRHFGSVTSWVGSPRWSASPAEEIALERCGIDWPIGNFDDLMRVTLLSCASERLYAPDHVALVHACYRQGDTRQQRGVLRALPLWPRGEPFHNLALAGCLSEDRITFDAIACDNPYPSRHFNAIEYEHMVLKALSLGIALSRIRRPERTGDCDQSQRGGLPDSV